MSHSSTDNGAVNHEGALGTAQKGTKAFLEGWWGWGGGGRVGVAEGQENCLNAFCAVSRVFS